MTLELNSEMRKGLECIVRNKAYLEREGVFGGERTIVGMVDEFYDLPDEIFHPFNGRLSYKRIIIPTFNDTKIGEIPPINLISFLDEIGDKPLASSQKNLRYENVKESLRDPDYPQDVRRMLTGFVVGVGGPIVAMVSTEVFGLGTLPAIVYGIAAFIGGSTLMGKTLMDERKNYENAEQLHLERTEESRMAYQELEVRASKADKLIEHYMDLFQERDDWVENE